MNAVFLLASGVRGTYQKPDFKSRAPKNWAPNKESSNWLMSGRG